MGPSDPVTVGICAHNEEETIGELIEAVFSEELDLKEVILVVAGDDATEKIAREKREDHGDIRIIREEEREGQSAAQTKILEKTETDLLFMIDGDGVFTPGSMEKMVEEYDGGSILYGREYPLLGERFTHRVIQVFWEMHHELNRRTPSFTTQIALIPSDLVDRIPQEIVIDDEYLAQKAREQGMKVKYFPGAIKVHNIKGDVKSFFRHRRKNWAGMIQIQRMGYENMQPTRSKLRFYLEYFLRSSPRKMIYLAVLGWVELLALVLAYWDSFRGRWPYIWKR
ncbi:MAG: glycosyltransferase family 2 protein [Candidatus Nanohaloarchaea archaeon]